MAGIYIHIPFCKQACHYCDFHFSTNLSHRTIMIDAITKELEMRKEYLLNEKIHSIYFGGGTPSLLTHNELVLILNSVHRNFDLAQEAEITLEANPDDLNEDRLRNLKKAGINRLSIGIQSFHDPHLKYMNRAHDAVLAKQCLPLARKAGFDNISIDLIYALPAEDHIIWKNDLKMAIDLCPDHISSYCLTIEDKTVFGKWRKLGKIRVMDDDFAAEQYELLVAALTQVGYLQYEISNFCLPGKESRHNSNYWKQQLYLGAGPGAHSFDGASRQFNLAHNQKYVENIMSGKIPAEREVLSREDQINEYLLTRLRTAWGCDLDQLKALYNYDLWHQQNKTLTELSKQGLIEVDPQLLKLTDRGKLLADQISTDLFVI